MKQYNWCVCVFGINDPFDRRGSKFQVRVAVAARGVITRTNKVVSACALLKRCTPEQPGRKKTQYFLQFLRCPTFFEMCKGSR